MRESIEAHRQTVLKTPEPDSDDDMMEFGESIDAIITANTRLGQQTNPSLSLFIAIKRCLREAPKTLPQVVERVHGRVHTKGSCNMVYCTYTRISM